MEQFVSILVFLLMMGIVLAVPSLQPGPRIFNGEIAEPGQFPFIVAIQNETEHYCGGSIINKNWIITAGHCIAQVPIKSPKILVGTNILHNGGKTYNVTKAIYHPDYNLTDVRNDIGLLKIDGDIEFNDLVQPISFGYAEGNDTVTVAGWGMDEDYVDPEDLRYVELRALSLEECQKRAQNYIDDLGLHLGPEQVCALANDTNKAPCWGDSGGPLISNRELVGIVSYAFSPCAQGVPDVYTRPSAYLDWINQNIQE